jgi:hypothetical protein
MGAFAVTLPTFAAQGVAVIPTKPDAPSMPMVRNPAKFGVAACLKLANIPRFSDANAGVWAGGTSGLTIVDIDSTDPVHTADAIELFGDTPLKVSTPGGVHLWYQHSGEGRRIRPFGKTFPVDILGSGLAILPPSTRIASGKKTAGAYRVTEGDFTALERLPIIRGGVLPSRDQPARRPPESSGFVLTGMREGDGRDNALFSFARRAAQTAGTKADLEATVLAENAKMAEPLLASIATQKAAQAWKYKMEGKLMAAGTRSAVMDLHTIERCQGKPGPFFLLAYLRSHHSADHRFAIVPEAIAPAIGQSPTTVSKNRDWLVEAGLLALVRRGGGHVDGRGIPNFYRLAQPREGTPQNLGGIELDTLSPLLRPNLTGRGSHD